MAQDVMVELLRDMMRVAMMLTLPPLLAALLVGLVVGLVQAITSIQEQTLTFVPKLLVIAIVFTVGGNWMARIIVDYTAELLQQLARYGAL